MKDLIIGFLSPLLILIACCGASTAVIMLGSCGRDMARVQQEDAQAQAAATRQAEKNLREHGETFAPVR